MRIPAKGLSHSAKGLPIGSSPLAARIYDRWDEGGLDRLERPSGPSDRSPRRPGKGATLQDARERMKRTTDSSRFIKQLLTYPSARGLDIDHPGTTVRRLRIIREKMFLRRIYEEWYRFVTLALPQGSGAILELGSGAGFLGEVVPTAIKSDILHIPDISAVLDAHHLPFRTSSLRAIVMVNVLHHLGRPGCFFEEAARCIRAEGRIVMVEPWVTEWSRFVYGRLHHEPFDPLVREWDFPSTGPLSGANGALPWILFRRDSETFLKMFPQWRILTIRPTMPFRYVLSGGVSFRSFVPGWSFGILKWVEDRIGNWMDRVAMFAGVVLQRDSVF